jgi:hypothetical protein
VTARPWSPPPRLGSFRRFVSQRVRKVLDPSIGDVVDVAAGGNRFRVLVRLGPAAGGVLEVVRVEERVREELEKHWPPELFSVLVVEPDAAGAALEAAWRLADLRGEQ